VTSLRNIYDDGSGLWLARSHSEWLRIALLNKGHYVHYRLI